MYLCAHMWVCVEGVNRGNCRARTAILVIGAKQPDAVRMTTAQVTIGRTLPLRNIRRRVGVPACLPSIRNGVEITAAEGIRGIIGKIPSCTAV